MVGARGPDERLEYPVDATAAKHRASVAQSTHDPDVAYADRPGDWEATRPAWPPRSDDPRATALGGAHCSVNRWAWKAAPRTRSLRSDLPPATSRRRRAASVTASS